jgi:hypothetical protein
MTPDRRKKRDLVFQDCLDQLQTGGRSLEEALSDHPEHAAALRPELETALWLQKSRQEFEPRPGFVAASRRRLVARIEAQSAAPRAPNLRWAISSLRYPSTWRAYAPRLVMIYLLLVTLLLSAGRVSRASLTWLPGDIGYPVKIAMENIAVLATPTAAGDARLHIQFAHRRLIEAQALVLEARYDQIPATVNNFAYHVGRAVRSVDRVARHDRGRAQSLALDLQHVLSKQTPLVVLLSGFTPEDARADFQNVLTIAENGISAMQRVLDSGGSGASLIGAAPFRGRATTYRIVRGRLTG